jgi:hypothetical protein
MACKQGIRHGPIDRRGISTESQSSAPKKEEVTVAPNGHIHISREDGSYTHINVSRIPMSAGDSFLAQLQKMAETRRRVTKLIVDGKAADLQKSDLEPLMRLWIKGVEAQKSGNTSTQFFLGPGFAEEFKNLSTILTAAGIKLDQFAAAAFSPEPPQQALEPAKISQRAYKHWILPFLLSALLAVAIFSDDVDYSFFVVLRFAVCASFGWWSWRAHERELLIWRNLFVLTAVFYNPFVPLSLDREWWQVANGLTIVIALLAAAKNILRESGPRE